MAKRGVRRFTVSASPEFLEEFDEVIGSVGWERSKAIRLAMRNFLTEYRWYVKGRGKG